MSAAAPDAARSKTIAIIRKKLLPAEQLLPYFVTG